MNLTLKKARVISDKTQKEMAQALGVCVDTYRKLENHPDDVTVKQAKIVSNITGISYDDIFFTANST